MRKHPCDGAAQGEDRLYTGTIVGINGERIRTYDDYYNARPTIGIAKDREGTWQFVKSFGFGFASVHLLKFANEKLRPDASNPKSFPSGHTFAAFSGASFLNRRYGPKYGIPAFVAAGFVWLVIMILLMASDYSVRTDLRSSGDAAVENFESD